jgi:putative spermidine/putrescine transport system permease protein
MIKAVKNIIPFSLLILLAVMPLVLGIGYAIFYSVGLVGVLNDGFTFEHWQLAFQNSNIVNSFIYTIFLSGVSIFICVTVAAFLSFYIGDKLQKGIMSYIIYLPMAFPALVASFFFFQFLSNAGFLSRILFKLGLIDTIESFPYLVNDRFSIGILATQFFLSLPFFIVLNLSIIKNENLERLKKLASSLGASKMQVWLKVMLPILLKKSFPSIVLFFIFKLGAYEIPLLLGRSSPETISVITVRKMQRFNLLDIPQGYVIAVLYAVLVFVLLAISLKPAKLKAHA